MSLLVSTINSELDTLNKNKIRLMAIGDLKSLPTECYSELMSAIENTKNNDRLTLVLALSYSSKQEITHAAKAIATDVLNGVIPIDSISEDTITNYLFTSNIPDPELMIRTSGEHRISNFLMWQLAYAELYFTDKLWPEFERQDFFDAIVDYQKRERRFGKTSEQLTE
jgi:undecaprenyl diphosphate synthase